MRDYSEHECVLDSDTMVKLLVSFHNAILNIIILRVDGQN